MKITINLDPIAFRAAGVDGTFDPSEMPNETLAYVFTYGARRAMQDAINSAAHKAKNDGDDSFDPATFVTARLDAFRNGDVTTRGGGSGGMSATDRMMIKIIRPMVKKSDEATYKNADAATRDKMVADYIAAMPDDHRDSLRKTAEQRIEREREDAAAIAALALGPVETD